MDVQPISKRISLRESRYMLCYLTFERCMVTPVRIDTALNFFVQALLHTVHVLEFICLNPPVLGLLATIAGFFKARYPSVLAEGTFL